jgi:DNA-binding response OmpR family regulator
VTQRILVVEDDAALGRVLVDNLAFEGYDARIAVDSASAVRHAASFRPDLIILDVTLPDGDGFEICSSLRGRDETPVIFLTARGQKADKLRGLGLGADDYVTKPFDLEELLARVHVVLRRAHAAGATLILGTVRIDFHLQQASRGSRSIHLTRREFDVLRYLAERRNRMVHRDDLLREVWGYPDVPITRSVDHAIARLRRKIEPDPHRPRFIHTVHGDGYCLTPSSGDEH